MRTASELYETYRTPSIVRAHQLRVAAVGVILSRGAGADERLVTSVGLFHDMGNILKMDLRPEGVLLPLIAPDSREALVQVKEEFRATYGDDEHAAAMAIAREIGLTETMIGMIDNMRFSRTEAVLREGSLEMRIVKYADLRVAPTGIVSMEERLREARERYRGKRFDTEDPDNPPLKLVEAEEMCRELERLVCAKAGIDPASITEEAAVPVIEKLRAFQI